MRKIFNLLLVILMAGGCAPKGSTPAQKVSPPKKIEEAGEILQKSDARDYVFMWTENSWREIGKRNALIQSGWYGLEVDTTRGVLKRLGILNVPSAETAFTGSNEAVKTLPEVEMNYSVAYGGKEYSFLNNGLRLPEGYDAPYRIIESGHTMQSMDMMYLAFKQNNDVLGRMEVKATARRFSLHFSLYTETQIQDARLSFSLALGPDYTGFFVADEGRSVIAQKLTGEGVVFLLPAGCSAREENGKLIFTIEGLTLAAKDFSGFGVICQPSANPKAALAEMKAAEALTVSAAELAPREGREREMVYDENRGVWVMDISRMSREVGSAFSNKNVREKYDRVVFSLENNSNTDVSVPVLFENALDPGFGRGITAVLRNAQTLEPAGPQVQVTRNWHTKNPLPEGYLSGSWFHGYSMLLVPAGQKITFELTLIYMMWGNAYAASHAQLCLAGWGGNQQLWETSSVGNPGESFCYNADGSQGHGFICDVHGMGINSGQGEYAGLVGASGGDMLNYVSDKGVQELINVKTWYKTQGPNLVELHYRGVTRDGAIQAEYSIYMGRTDDVTRALHSFSYTFLKDVNYKRLSFYAAGYDTYNNGGFETMAVGNDNGPIEFILNGQRQWGDFPLNTQLPKGYAGGKAQQIAVPGTGFWAAWTGATGKPYSESQYVSEPQVVNRMLALREYRAELNGQIYTQPSFNLYVTETPFANDFHGYALELAPPAGVKTIKAGSTVSGTAEYLQLPYQKSAYYFNSPAVLGIPEDYYNTWQLPYYYWQRMNFTASAQKGEITRALPLKVKAYPARQGETAAEITINGGLSYQPVTFTHLSSYRGYRLEVWEDGSWQQVEQSLHGKDFWQCDYSAEEGFSVTYNVAHNCADIGAEYRYRLVREP